MIHTLLWGTYKDQSKIGATVLTTGEQSTSILELPSLPAGQGPTWIAKGPDPDTVLVVNNPELRSYRAVTNSDGSIQEWQLNTVVTTPDWTRIVHGVFANDHSIFLAVDYGAGQTRSFRIKESASGTPLSSVTYAGQGGYPPLQYAPHPHGVYQHPLRPWVYVADMGLDCVHLHHLSSAGELELRGSYPTAPCTGPRHLAIHPSGRALYTINEIGLSISSFSIDQKDGSLVAMGDEISVLPPHLINLRNPGFNRPDGSRGMQGAEILIPRDGRQLYATYRNSPNGANDGIAIMDIDDTSLSPVPASIRFVSTLGTWPRGMQFDPKQELFLAVANQETNLLVVFERDVKTGDLHVLAQHHAVGFRRPTAVLWL